MVTNLLNSISDCEFVLNLHKKFLDLFETGSFNPEVVSIIETAFTLMSFIYVKIVAFESAGKLFFPTRC